MSHVVRHDSGSHVPCIDIFELPDSDFDGIYALPLESIVGGFSGESLLQTMPGDLARNRVTYRQNGTSLDMEYRGEKDSTYLERLLRLKESFHLIMACYTTPLTDELCRCERFNVYIPRSDLTPISTVYVARTGPAKIREY